MSGTVNKDLRGKTVFVGLSGGVDSAVTAATLQRAGARVVGVFIKGWYPPGLPCTWAADRRDAMRVAAALHIPFVTLDASDEYKRGVIEYLLREYAAGRTPNPDIMCNREVKFGAFYRYAKDHGADFIATGHYANTENGRLYRGVDSAKDQSYFLWAVPKEALKETLFPLGGLKKSTVRELASAYTLPVAEKRDSQGICFLGSISVEDFLKSEFENIPGKAVDIDGKEIGTHSGVLLHTLGERIALADAPPGPWYVIRKKVSENILVVAKEREGQESVSALKFTEENFFTEPTENISAQYRYHGPVLTGTLSITERSFTTEGILPEPAAAGQSIVFYHNDELIGGGIIAE